MARRLDRIRKLLKRSADVQEGAACTRALVGLLGENSIDNWMQTVQLSQGMLTARIWQSQVNVPMPRSLSKQLDPNDSTFWPPSSVMMSLFARERTILSDGSAGPKAMASVDPWGWFTPHNGPSLTVWASDGEKWYCPGKLPLESKDVQVSQTLTQAGHGVETIVQMGKIQLEMLHWPSAFGKQQDGQLTWSMVYRVRALEDCIAAMALVLRPVEFDGVHPIFDLKRNRDGLWHVDGRPFLMTQPSSSLILTSRYGQPDLWKQCQSLSEAPSHFGTVDLHCSVGQASGAEVFSQSLRKGEVLSAMAFIHPPKNIQAMRRCTAEGLWRGAVEERNTLRDLGSRVEIANHQVLFEHVQQRLLSQTGEMDYEGCLAAIALARLGYVQEAGNRIGRWLEDVSIESALDSESVSVLLWVAAEFVLWTRERSWLNKHRTKWSELLDVLTTQRAQPGGRKLFGEEGSARWSEIWRVAALLNGVRALRMGQADGQRWALAGAAARDQLVRFMGASPWASMADRSADGASAALLATGWLNLLPLDTPGLIETEEYLSTSFMHAGGILSQGGAHIAQTGIYLALQKKRDPQLDVVSTFAEFASSTGALPEVHHRQKGALGEGDSLLSAAIFALMVLDDVVVHRDGLELGGFIRQAHDLPTPFGKIDILDGVVQQYGVLHDS